MQGSADLAEPLRQAVERVGGVVQALGGERVGAGGDEVGHGEDQALLRLDAREQRTEQVGVGPAVRLDGRELGTGPVTTAVRAAYEQAVVEG